jgi:hypothetical protein
MIEEHRVVLGEWTLVGKRRSGKVHGTEKYMNENQRAEMSEQW